MSAHNKIRIVVESAATVTWFIMDGTWMFGCRLTVMFAALTAILHVALLGLTGSKTGLLSALSVNAWVFANVCWMLGDIYGVELGAAKLALITLGGLCLIALSITDAKRLGWLRGWRNN